MGINLVVVLKRRTIMIRNLLGILILAAALIGVYFGVSTFMYAAKHTYTVHTNGSLLPHGYSCVGGVVVHNRGGGNLLGSDGKVVGCTGEVRLNWAEREEWENNK